MTWQLLATSDVLHLSIGASPSRINPLLATDSASSEVARWVFDGLVKFDTNGTIVPDLAESFDFKDDTTLYFYLKEGVKWHDGKPFTAHDVVFTFELINSPKLISPYKDDFSLVDSVVALDDYTLKVRYKQPYFKALSIWMSGILPKHLWEHESDPMTSELNKMAVGTGAYKMTKPFGPNERISLLSHDTYLPHAAKIGQILLHAISDEMTQFISLKAGKLDIAGLSALQVSRQIDERFKARYQLIEQPSNSYTYLGFNLDNPKFANPRIREAISLAIDKQALVDLLFFSHAQICHGPFMPQTHAYPATIQKDPYDPKRAKEILKSLGYSSENPFVFELSTNTGNDIRTYAAQIIQYQLAQVGIDMQIRTMEWQAFLNTVVMPRRFEAVLLGWNLSLIPDARSIWHSSGIKDGGFNLVGYSNTEVDRLIDEAQGMVNQEAFGRHYQQIFHLITQDRPYIFLYIPNSITAVSKNIQGVEPSIIGIMHNQINWTKEEIAY